jgi:M6 family metalloprotease-like protein
MHRLPHCFVALVLSFSASSTLPAQDPVRPTRSAPVKGAAAPDLGGFRTVDTAVTARLSRAASPTTPSQPAYLGVHLDGAGGKLVVAHVEPESPAAQAGLEKGDVLRQVDGRALSDAEVLRDLVHTKAPGDALQLAVLRRSKPIKLRVTLAATSRPLSELDARPDLGIRTANTDEGLRIDRFLPGSAAARAGLKVGDVIVKIDGAALAGEQRLTDALGERKPGDTVTLTVKRDDKELEVRATLAASPGDISRLRWDNRALALWKKDVYRLAVVLIAYPDVAPNEKLTAKEWDRAFFSRGVYTGQSATGQRVYGSLNDYYHELSCGAFRALGKVFDPVQVGRKRAEYGSDSNRSALLTEALDKLLARDGRDALKDFDGLCFIYAGGRVQTNRGGLYWPHRATVAHQGKRWPYFICAEGGARMGNISVFCHEFGHLLGLPDLYARPENPGSEGLGVWCAMSNQSGNGQPQHFSAWCKEQLGWLKPAVLDPTVKQKLVLGPIEESSKECFKVLIRADGSEYLLLENRTKKGFDRSLPAEGLLIWHIVDGKPLLAESHGIPGPGGPRNYLGLVPYPSKANNAFTPYTTPSSRSQKGGGLPVHITNIQRLPDGRITFFVGYEYL